MGIQPEGEDIRRAIKWISDERKYTPGQSLKQLVEAASLKFDLSPIDENYLYQFYKKDKD